ncbi:hypothetical protein [Synechococcus sp. MIT S9507]|uniref:hypothetical protein n=1 Tax=Synechococcus sp. MIT S9507 TaxID=3082544 RepID=UPI0039B464B9
MAINFSEPHELVLYSFSDSSFSDSPDEPNRTRFLLKFELDGDTPKNVQIVVEHDEAGNKATAVLVPKTDSISLLSAQAWLALREAVGDGGKLDYAAMANSATDAAMFQLATLRRNLARIEVKLSGDGVFGLKSVAGQTSAEGQPKISAEVLLDLPHLGPDHAGGRTAVLTCRIDAEIALDVNLPNVNQNNNATARLRIEATIQAKAALAGVSIGLPDLPSIDLALPKVVLPNLNLGRLGWSGPDMNGLIGPLTLPIPRIPGLSAEVGWPDGQPTANASLQNGEFRLTTTPSDLTVGLKAGDTTSPMVEIKKFQLSFDGQKLKLSSTEILFLKKTDEGKITEVKFETLDQPFEFDRLSAFPLVVRGRLGAVSVAFNAGTLTMSLKVTQLNIVARDDPEAKLVVSFTIVITATQDSHTTRIEDPRLIAPDSLKLVSSPATALDGLIRLGVGVKFNSAPPEVMKGVFNRVERLLAAVTRGAIAHSGAVRDALADLASPLLALLEQAGTALSDALTNANDVLAIELRVDAKTWRPRQLLVSPKANGAKASTELKGLGLELTLPSQMRPTLIWDFERNWQGLMVMPPADDLWAVVKTDLWLEYETAAAAPVRTHDNGDDDPLLIAIEAKPNPGKPLLLFALQHGRLRAFQTFGTNAFVEPATGDAITAVGPSGPLEDAKIGDHVSVRAHWGGSSECALALLPSPIEGDAGDGGALNDIARRVEVTAKEPERVELTSAVAEINLKLKVIIAEGFDPVADLTLKLDLRSFKANLEGDKVAVEATGKESFDGYGLRLEFNEKSGKEGEYEMLVLDFANGDFGVGLGEKARLSAFYDRFAANGDGLRFDVEKFRVGRGGLDLSATAVPDPVVIAGVDQPFRFTSGGIAIESGSLRGGRISGKGQLPPALVGEAEASIDISLVSRNGELQVESANAALSGGKKPLYSSGTKFRITVEELGFSFVEADGYHFYFTLTGAAEFRPEGGAFSEGLLKNLKSVVIKLDRTPLAGDPSELLKHIQFQVEIAPPVTANLFDIFKFELRGVGFHPAYEGFTDTPPAMSISGQVAFLDVGDVISAEFDFHQMWIAPPAGDNPLPRLRFDGLGVAIDVNGLGRVEGTAVSVDRNTPGLYDARLLPDGVTAEGFLARGRLDLKGMGRLGAAMGMLELRRGGADPRHAMFLYAQLEKLSEPIDTPIGRFNLREAGVGVGIGFTLASLAALDRAKSARDAVALLDEVSRIQGDLSQFEAWAPQYERRNVTLALRGLITYASVSTSSQYNEKKEKELPNPLLFDVVVALRTDLTFLMNVRAWTSYNYNDWISEPGAAWKSQPLMRGYMYFSVPRREFMARLVSDGPRAIGPHPQLPKPLIDAMQGTRWSSTLYIRPGLFHTEFGWPYELGFALGKRSDNFYLNCSGGLIFRIEDATMLYGVALRADGRARFEARAGGGSFGASVSALASFAVAARFIALIAPLDPKDTLFYGMISIEVAITFNVSVWFSFKIFRKRITLRVSFSLGLALAVAAEIVISPGDGLAGQVRASVGVRAFGRSMMLGLDFAFGSGALEKARARVERFMDLGLASPLAPDDGQGTALPPTAAAEPSRGGRAKRSDDRIAKQPPRAPVPLPPADPQDDGTPVPPQIGRPIGKTEFWAMLFLVRDGSAKGERSYVMQLLPRDFSDENAVTLQGANTAGFFAEPRVDSLGASVADHRIQFDADIEEAAFDGLSHVGWTGVAAPLEFVAEKVCDTNMDTDYDLLRSEAGKEKEKVTLNDLLAEMFLSGWGDVNGDRGGYGEPVPIAPQRGDAAPTDPREAAERMARAGDSRVRYASEGGAHGQKLHESLVAEERRSAFIGGLGASAIEMAERGPVRGPDGDNWSGEALAGDIPAHKLGLTFILQEQAVDLLFPKVKEPPPNGAPAGRKARFTVRKRVKRAPGAASEFSDESSVTLFRHPSESFENRQPRLAPPRLRAGMNETEGDRRIRMTEKGVALAWDLEPAWGASRDSRADGGFIADPEADLRTYEIYRVFEGLRRPLAATFNVLACETLDYTEKDGVIVARSMPLDRKLVDDFSKGGVPEDLRALLLGLPLPEGRSAEDIWFEHADPGADISVTYTVIARDYMGFAADPEPLELRLRAPVVRADAPVQVQLSLNYRPKKTDGERSGLPKAPSDKQIQVEPELALTIARKPRQTADEALKNFISNLRALAEVDGPKKPAFRLRIRKAELCGGGQFGTDAVDEARARPGQADIDRWCDGADEDLWFYPSKKLRSNDSADGFPVTILVSDAGEGSGPKRKTLRFRIAVANADGQPGSAPNPKQDETEAKDSLLGSMGAPPIDGETTFHARRVFAQMRPMPSVQLSRVPSLWQPADLLLGLSPKQQESGFVALQVERIEHPFALDFQALGFEDLFAEGGVLEGLYPPVEADLTPLSEPRALDQSFLRLRDVQRRNAIRLSFNVAGDTLAAPAAALKGPLAAPLVGGFDLFEIDPDVADVIAASPDDVLAIARRRGSLKVLPRSLDGLDPDGVTDFQKLAVHYPTESARRDRKRRPTADVSRPRARWFSRAEAGPVFPKPQLRRSLFPAPDEALIATLLAAGRVNLIQVSMRHVSGSDPKSLPVRVAKAEADAVAREWTLRHSGDSLIAEISQTPEADGNLSPAALRQLLRALVWRAGSDEERKREGQVLETYETWRMGETSEAGAERFDWAVSVTAKWVTADEDKDILRASETETISLHTSLAAPLAEAIDQLRYAPYGQDGDPAGGKVYRRYEPVIDTPQPLEADNLEALIEAAPNKRDPHGWGFLRATGLAAGLRLFDTETGDYVRGRTLARLIAKAMNRAVRRYVDDRAEEAGATQPLSAQGLGQPMVELLSREDALFLVGSDDGQDKEAADDGFFGSAAATMAQIALRPMPHAFAVGPTSEDARDLPVRYLLLRRAATDGTAGEPKIKPVEKQDGVDQELFVLDPDGARFVWDLANLAAPGVGRMRKRMIDQDAAAEIGLGAGSTLEDELDLGKDRLKSLKDGDPVLLVRLTLLGAKEKGGIRQMWDQAKDKLLGHLDGWVTADEWIDAPVAAALGIPDQGDLQKVFDPFERFDPLEGTILTALTRLDCLRLDGENKSVLYYPLHQCEGGRGLPVNELRRLFPKAAALAEAFNALDLTIQLKTAFEKAKPESEKEEFDFNSYAKARDKILEQAAPLSARLAIWTERFLVHGAAQRFGPPEGGAGEGDLTLPFGLAAITDPDGLARAPDADGAITLLLVERDRYGARRRFMIRPWGRYASLAAEADGDMRPRTLSGALPDNAQLNAHCVEVTLNRSEPIETPTILYAGPPLGTEDIPPASGDLPAVDFIVARSLDHVIADANISAQRALQPQFHGVAFRRRYADLDRVRRLAGLEDYDGLDAFGPDASVPAGEVIEAEVLDGEVLEALAEVAPDSWRGADLYRLRALPHCFEVFGMAHVSAGVVVSDVSVAVLPRPRTTLRLPTVALDGDLADLIPADPPKFSFRRLSDNEVKVLFILPLVRNADCMTEASLQAWLGPKPETTSFEDPPKRELPRAFRLPDAQTSYRISFDARDRSSTGPEIEIVPRAVDPTDSNDNKLFAVAPTGPSFTKPITVDAPAPVADSQHWHLKMEAPAVVKPAPAPDAPDFTADAATVGAALGRLVLTKDAPQLNAWLAASPRRTLLFTASKTNNLEALRNALVAARAALEFLEGDLEAAAVLNWLGAAESASADATLWKTFVEEQPNVESLVPSCVLAPAGAGGFTTNLKADWRWPHKGNPELVRPAAPAAIRQCLRSGLDGDEKSITDIITQFLGELRAIWLHRNRDKTFANRRPGAAPMPAALAAKALPPAGVADNPPPDGFGVTVVRVFEFTEAGGADRRIALDALLAALEAVDGAPLGLADAVRALDWLEVLDATSLASVAAFSVPLPWHLIGLADEVDGLTAPPERQDAAATLLVAIPPDAEAWERLAAWLKNGGDATSGPMTSWGEAAVALLFGAAGVPYLRAFRPGSPPVSARILPISTRTTSEVQR